MVQKIKYIVLIILSLILCFLSFSHKGDIEVNLLKTLLPKSIFNTEDVILTANKSSSIIKVVFEAEDENSLDNLIKSFEEKIDKSYFELNKPDVSNLLNKYLSNPNNFLSDKTKNLLKNKKYDEVYSDSINMLYSPATIQLGQFDKDPYLLSDDFILASAKISSKLNHIDNKFYDSMVLKIKADEGLSPDLCNKKIRELIKIKKELSKNNSKIYLAGTPVHSYYTSIKSVVSINFICILSSLLVIGLTYYFFRNLKLLIPIILSISFGMLSGFCATRLWFNNFQIITMVFSTTLIGIGIDYSYHFFFGGKDKNFIKNLTYSFITSSIPFILLYLTDIELLQQVSIFSIFGLLGIYFVVLFIYPDFKITQSQKNVNISSKFYKLALIIIVVLSLSGFLRLHFNDTLTALYTPSRELKKAEILYSKISNDNTQNAKIITVKGNNFDEILSKEEKVTPYLAKDNIEYLSLSKFMPSKKVQKENFDLVKELYKNNLNNYSDILSNKQIQALKNSKFSYVKFDIKDYPFLKDFILKDNTSIIYIFTNKEVNVPNIKVIDFKSDIENSMKNYRKLLILIFPIAIIVLAIILSIFYDFKKALKMLLPPVMGVFCAIGTALLITGEINIFSIIAAFLVIGFTMDYSIFRQNRNDKNDIENAIFVSSLTTSFSFLLLSFCNFKLLSSISLILLFGIITSYVLGKLIFQKQS